jgi:hypothetical protein
LSQLVIDNDQLAEDFFEDATILGVQCGVEPHHFIWMVNKRFAYDFRYQAGNEIVVKKRGRTFTYPVFSCCEPQADLHHYVYANQHDGEYLLNELRHFDYVWLIKGELKDNLPEQICSELRVMETVQLVTQLTNDKIINKTRLVL